MADQFNLSPELAKQALEEFGETPEKRTVALSDLRARIAALPAADQLADTTDANIIRFLRARKYDIDKALESTKQFKHFQDKFADVIAAPGLQKLVLMSKDFLEVFREPNGGKVYVAMRPKMGLPKFTPELKAESPRAMMQINYWMFDYLSKDPQCQIAGMVICNTFADLTFFDQLAMQNMAPMSDQTATFQLFNILGTRLKGAFIFHEPIFMKLVWFLARPFMSTKIQQRFHLCGADFSRISTVCADLSILPEYLGGSLKAGSYPNFIEGIAYTIPP